MARSAFLYFSLFSVADAAKWAVIAAGSNGYYNYRHQADACHAYQIMKKTGIPDENIILMMQDDVANDPMNPFPGKLYNQPGDNPPDVYAGCKVDYRGDIVTAQLFMDVLTGKTSNSVKKVLKSGPDDTVFVNFVDHGGPGIIAFPNGPVLHVKELSNTLAKMQSQKMFKQLLFYMEACESGSMFPDLKTDSHILAVTAANGQESSWGTYCGSEAVVKGKNLGSCLGDLFSVNWMQDTEKGKLKDETIGQQIASIKTLTNKSHVMVFGDTSFEGEAIGVIEANSLSASEAVMPSNNQDVRDTNVMQAMWHWQHAVGAAKEKAWKNMVEMIQDRDADTMLFTELVRKACEGVNSDECRSKFFEETAELKDIDCHYQLVQTVYNDCPRSPFHDSPGGWNGFNMQYSRVLVNLCEGQMTLGKSADELQAILKETCGANQLRSAPQLVV